MRGFAVMLVIIYHSGLEILPGGYLGVDVFFVLSGFLITQVMLRDIGQGTFSLAHFYASRARRLFPSMFTVVAMVALLGPIFMDAASVANLPAQIFGGITYTANFVMAAGGGYFELASEQKPLLHLWSLAVEEQYYLIAPFVLILTARRYLLALVAAICALSAGLCFLHGIDEIHKFYMLPTRAWQIGLGSLAALVCPKKLKAASLPLTIPAIAGLVILAIFPFSGPSPNLGAALACVAAVVLIGANAPMLSSRAMHLTFGKIGDISYSLYLVHWPIFVFFKQAWVGDAPAPLLVLLTASTFPMAYVLYQIVERPMHRMQMPDKAIAQWSVIATGVLAIVGFAVYFLAPPAPDSWKPNVGLSANCEFRNSFSPIPECLTSSKPELLVWGDSFAMHLVPGLRATEERGFVQATKSVCGPTVGVSPFDVAPVSGYGREWGKDCLSFNQSVIQYLAQTPSIRTVILASPMRQYISQKGYQLLIDDRNNHVIDEEASVNAAVDAFGRTVKAVRSMGRKVVIIAPPPTAGFQSNLCIDRRNKGKALLGPMADCQIPIHAYQERQKEVFEALSEIERNYDVGIIRFDDVLCRVDSCATEIDGVTLYNDAHHLSVRGSEVIARLIGLPAIIDRYAR